MMAECLCRAGGTVSPEPPPVFRPLELELEIRCQDSVSVIIQYIYVYHVRNTLIHQLTEMEGPQFTAGAPQVLVTAVDEHSAAVYEGSVSPPSSRHLDTLPRAYLPPTVLFDIVHPQRCLGTG